MAAQISRIIRGERSAGAADFCTRNLEHLEPRVLLAVARWDGGPLGTGTDFHLAENWEGDVLPGPADDAIIPDMAGAPTLNITQSIVLGSLTSSEAIHNSTGTLTLNGESRFSARFTLQSGGIAGSGDLYFDNEFFWSAGFMTGTGRTVLEPGPAWTVSGTGTRSNVRELSVERAFAMSNGTLTGTGNITFHDAFNWTGGTLSGSGTITLEDGPTWTISSGSRQTDRPLIANRPISLVGGTLTGSGSITANEGFTWTGGNDVGTGTLFIPFGSVLNVNGAGTKSMRRLLVNHGTVSLADSALTLIFGLENHGDLQWSSGSIVIGGGVLVNHGLIAVDAALDISLTKTGNTQFVNHGSLTKQGAGTLAIGAFPGESLPITNNGTLVVSDGEMRLFGGGTNSGVLGSEPGGTLYIAGTYIYWTGSLVRARGALTLADGSHVFAAGTLEVSGALNLLDGTASINNVITPSSMGPIGASVTFHVALGFLGALTVDTGSVQFRRDQTFASIALSTNGIIYGAGTITVQNSLVWSGGSFGSGGGQLLLAQGSHALLNGNSKSLSRSMISSGQIEWTSGNLGLSTGGSMTASGTMVIDSATTIDLTRAMGAGNFTNDGNITNRGAGSVGIGSFINTGSVLVQAGTLRLRAGPANANAGSIVGMAASSIQFEAGYSHLEGSSVHAAGTLRFTAGTHNFPAGTLSSTGTLTLSGGTISINDVLSPTTVGSFGAVAAFNAPFNYSGPLTVSGGMTTFAFDQTFSAVTLSAGALAGPGGIVVENSLQFLGGAFTGTGLLHLSPAASATFSGSATKGLQRPTQIDGSVLWTGGSLEIGAAVRISGAMIVDSAAILTLRGLTAPCSFTIDGTLEKHGAGQLLLTGDGGLFAMPVRVDGSGLLHAVGGTLRFSSGTVPDFAGRTRVDAGTLLASDHVFAQFAGGVLAGGEWEIAGVVDQLPGQPVFAIGAAATVRLIGAAALIRIAGTNALAQLETVNGELRLEAGAMLNSTPASGTFMNAGSLLLGAASTLSITGSFEQAAAAVLEVEVSGPGPSSFGRVVASGAALVAGSVAVEYVGGFIPARGDSFRFLACAALTGRFDTVIVPPPPGADLKSPVVYDADGARLIITHIADWNNDLAVNVPDIFAFLSSWFAGEGDFDGNGANGVPDIFAYLSAWFAA